MGFTQKEGIPAGCHIGVSDYNRCWRELQAITTNKFIAVDHTMEAVKTNDKKQLKGSKANFDVATKTGEIALAVLMPNTHFK